MLFFPLAQRVAPQCCGSSCSPFPVEEGPVSVAQGVEMESIGTGALAISAGHTQGSCVYGADILIHREKPDYFGPALEAAGRANRSTQNNVHTMWVLHATGVVPASASQV